MVPTSLIKPQGLYSIIVPNNETTKRISEITLTRSRISLRSNPINSKLGKTIMIRRRKIVRNQILLIPVASQLMPSNRLIALINKTNRQIVANSEVRPLNSSHPNQGRIIMSIPIHENHRATIATHTWMSILAAADIEYFLSTRYHSSSTIATAAMTNPQINNPKNSLP